MSIAGGGLDCSVIGGGLPRGLCGSGLVDAAAVALDLGWVAPSGRMTEGRKSMPLAGTVTLTQADIRELQLAKGAVAAGFDLLLCGSRLTPSRVYLAGAFGNYIRGAGARRIGLLPAWVDHPTAAGNTALRGRECSCWSLHAANRSCDRSWTAPSTSSWRQTRDSRMRSSTSMGFPANPPFA